MFWPRPLSLAPPPPLAPPPGRLLSGDNAGHLHLWEPREGGAWAVQPRPFRGHTAAVEDLQWAPREAPVWGGQNGGCGVGRGRLRCDGGWLWGGQGGMGWLWGDGGWLWGGQRGMGCCGFIME